jgi:hypothetical protein
MSTKILCTLKREKKMGNEELHSRKQKYYPKDEKITEKRKELLASVQLFATA